MTSSGCPGKVEGQTRGGGPIGKQDDSRQQRPPRGTERSFLKEAYARMSRAKETREHKAVKYEL